MSVNEVFSGALADPTIATEPLAPRGSRWGLVGWCLRRLAFGLLTLLFVSVLIFVLTHVIPSNPARSVLGQFAEPQQLAAVTKELGLDKPIVSQYFSWVGGVVHGDLGVSYTAKEPVLSIIGIRLENSLTLVALVALLAVPISVTLGVLAATRRDSVIDHVVSLTTIGFGGLPEFVIGILLTIVFAVTLLHLVPAVVVAGSGQNPVAHPAGMILPVATLVLAVIPYLTRLVRGSMVEALDSAYVEMARLKGVPEGYVVRRHALRNAMVPMIQGTGLSLIYLLGNIVVVEYLFSYPGMGQALANAVGTRDLPMIQGIALLFAAMFILFNIVADFLTVIATPRLRTEI